MNLVMMKSPTFWNNGNLVNCFVETLGHLISGLETGFIGDVFFPKVATFLPVLRRTLLFMVTPTVYCCCQVNLLDRIKNKQVISDVVGYLRKRMRRYEQTNDIMDIFN